MRSAHEAISLSYRAQMREEILTGLRAPQKRVSPKYLYDTRGSQLFEAICRTPEYYVSRVEKALLGEVAEEIARLAGPGTVVIEPGSGNSEKIQLILEPLRPSLYVPVEICAEALHRAVVRLGEVYPWLRVSGRCADFDAVTFEGLPPGRRVVFFPGSTVGNFEPHDAVHFLSRLRRLAGPQGALVIGVDLEKEEQILNAAYNDRAGITAAFNLNLLARLNRELDADFDLGAFEHRALYLPERKRVEMHLFSRIAQRVRIDGEMVAFERGEGIHTENSYKYTIGDFRDLAAAAGWNSLAAWSDSDHRFSVQFFT